MVPLSLFCFSAFTWSASSGASIGHNINAYTEESPTKSIGGFVWKESNRVPWAVGNKRRTPRILDGRKALLGEFPWMASIHWNSEDKQGHQCGGSIISRKHILTAAHCIPTNELTQMTVLVGGHFQDESLEPRAQRIAVKTTIKYFDYNPVSYKHDIAILVLEKKIELNSYTAIVNLPLEKEYLYGDVDAIATGWGNTFGDPPFVQHYKGDPTTAAPTPAKNEFYEVSPVLKATNLAIFNNTQCNLWHKVYTNYQLDNYTMCAGASSRFYEMGNLYPGDTAKGDSGGPLVIQENEKWVVVGITSLTHSNSERPLPGIYTRVSEYLFWIKVQMNKD